MTDQIIKEIYLKYNPEYHTLSAMGEKDTIIQRKFVVFASLQFESIRVQLSKIEKMM